MWAKRRSRVWLLALAAALALAPAKAGSAAPRRIAVLNAAADGEAGATAAAELRRALLGESELSPLAAGDLSRALESPLPVESEVDVALRQARAELEVAHRAMVQFEQGLARRALGRAEALLLPTEPDERVVELLAEVNFQAGLVHLRDQNRGLAVDAFRQVLRLVPGRAPLDPARYPPEVVQAFAEARKPSGESGVLEVSATFDDVPVYLDGVRVGVTPLRRRISPGPHYLLLAAPEYYPEGQKLDAGSRDRISLVIELERLPLARRASDMRRRLASARGARRDTLHRAGRDVALLAGVDAVLVIGDGAGKPSVALYERNADRLSLFRPVNRDVGKLFGLMVPAPPPGPMDLLPVEERDETPWYAKPWGLAGLGGGAALAILGVLVLSGTDVEQDRNAEWVGF
jgi:PEGA domain